ncbi:hypothetical protein Tco_0201281 [Tanacetum coccineum]
MRNELSLRAAKELEDDGVLDMVEHLGVMCSEILAFLVSFPRGILAFRLTFPIADFGFHTYLGFLTVESVANIFLMGCCNRLVHIMAWVL